MTGASRKDRELCESNVWYLTKLAKEGRSRGFLTVFVTQKQTADAIPTAIRDVCQVGLSLWRADHGRRRGRPRRRHPPIPRRRPHHC